MCIFSDSLNDLILNFPLIYLRFVLPQVSHTSFIIRLDCFGFNIVQMLIRLLLPTEDTHIICNVIMCQMLLGTSLPVNTLVKVKEGLLRQRELEIDRYCSITHTLYMLIKR